MSERGNRSARMALAEVGDGGGVAEEFLEAHGKRIEHLKAAFSFQLLAFSFALRVLDSLGEEE